MTQQTQISATELAALGFEQCSAAALPDLWKHKTAPLWIRANRATMADIIFLAYKLGHEHGQNGCPTMPSTE
jgi:hypothetical protein